MNRNIFGPMYNPAAVAITGGTISGVTISDSTINQKFTTSTNPASSVATTTAIVDAYNGVVITTNVNNTQTIANPTTAANIKIFTVINNDTSSSNQTIKANGVDFVLTPGEAQSFIWDGSAWGPTDLGITEIPVPVTQGGTGAATAQAAINTLTAVSGATNEYVLTKDTVTGNAIFKAAAGGGGGGGDFLVMQVFS